MDYGNTQIPQHALKLATVSRSSICWGWTPYTDTEEKDDNDEEGDDDEEDYEHKEDEAEAEEEDEDKEEDEVDKEEDESEEEEEDDEEEEDEEDEEGYPCLGAGTACVDHNADKSNHANESCSNSSHHHSQTSATHLAAFSK